MRVEWACLYNVKVNQRCVLAILLVKFGSIGGVEVGEDSEDEEKGREIGGMLSK